MQFASAQCCDDCPPVARVFNKPAPRLRGLGFATPGGGGGGGFRSAAPTYAAPQPSTPMAGPGTAETSESECMGRIAAGTATSFSLRPGSQGLPSERRGTCFLKAPSSGGGFASRAPAAGPVADSRAASNVQVTVSPTLQTQISPQISPQFIQQFQPTGSPVGASAAQGGSPLTGPAQGVSAADLTKLMQTQAESQSALLKELRDSQAAQAAQAAAESKARQERADAEKALQAAQNQALIETLTKAGAAAAPAPAPSGPQMVSAPAGGGGPVSPPISIPEAAGPATTAVSVHSGAANMLPIALAVLAVGALVLYSRKGKRR